MKTPAHLPLFALLAVAPFAVATTMGAQPPLYPMPEPGLHAPSSPSFAELDRNNDGVITRDEIPADHAMAAALAQHDLDGDQAISRAEYDAWLRAGDEVAATGGDEDEDDDDDED